MGAGDDDEATHIVMPGLRLPGSSQESVNHAAIAILSSVIGLSLLGLCLDHLICRRRLKGAPDSRPRGWVVGMLVSSYALLVPGLFVTLFCYKLAAVNGFKTLNEAEETMVSFAHSLFTSGSVVGGLAVVTFAIVIPVAKLVLLVAGGIFRHSRNEARVAWSRRSISCVQKISKWASPDMFAYILLLYLIRGLNHPPILNGLMELDIGFTCFSTFCVASTISSLGVRMPEEPVRTVQRRPVSTLPVVIAAVVLTAGFFTFLVIGMQTPCMALRLDLDLLIESGQLERSLEPIIKGLHIQELAADDVNMLQALRDLWSWVCGGPDGKQLYEANSLIAFLMLGVFVFVFTVADMLTLLVTALLLHIRGRRPKRALAASHIFRKLSMLDVAIVGVMVVVLAGSIYRKMGVILSMRIGLLYLSLAELSHYATYYLVSFIADRAPQVELENSEGEPEGGLPAEDSDEDTSEDEDEDSGECETPADVKPALVGSTNGRRSMAKETLSDKIQDVQ